jgi:integrase
MASISKDPGKRGATYRILFKGIDGKRRTLRLGNVSNGQAGEVKRHVEELLRCKANPALEQNEKTRQWVTKIDGDMRAKLADFGLVAAEGHTRLGPFIAAYIKQREPLVKPSTLRTDRQTEASLIAKFGADKRLRDITEGDAIDFRNYLLTVGGPKKKNLATGELEPTGVEEATVRKRCSVAGKFMLYAMRHGWISSNPFGCKEVPRTNVATEHKAFISAADAQSVLDQLHGTQWTLLFALSRWGGLRVGSEPRQLTWADVNLELDRFLVRSPKTAHHAGLESRWVPIFPELAPLFAARFEEAAGGETPVLPIRETPVLPMLVGRTDASLRKPIEKAIKAAGLTQWPRLWHNLRASRQTELEEMGFSRKAVCSWLGNSSPVADKHYLQVTDDQFRKAAQTTAQPLADTKGHERPKGGAALLNLAGNDTYNAGENEKMLPVGLEPTTY